VSERSDLMKLRGFMGSKTYTTPATFTGSWNVSSWTPRSGSVTSPYNRLVKTVVRNSGGRVQDRAKYRLAHGYDRILPYSVGVDDLSYGRWMHTWSNSGGTASIGDHFYSGDAASGASLDVVSTTSGWYPTARVKALSQLNQRAKQQLVGGGEALAELRKTTDMFQSVASRIAGAMAEVRFAVKRPDQFLPSMRRAATLLGVPLRERLHLAIQRSHLSNGEKSWGMKKASARAKGRASHVSDQWLALRYGWGPLYSDLFGAMKFCFEYYRDKPIIRRVVGRSDPDKTGYDLYSGRLNGYYGSGAYGHPTDYGVTYTKLPTAAMSWYVDWKDRKQNLLEIGYYLRMTNPHLVANSQLGLADPFTIAWQLVPLSFVVDWFLNVGDVLDQLSAFNGYEWLAGWETVTQFTERTVTITPLSFASGSSHTFTPAKTVRTLFASNRKELLSIQYFGLCLDNGLNVKRTVDGVALLLQKAFR